MKITIVYDNVVADPCLTPDWGFACLVETGGQKLLFDTGAKGAILLDNMATLGIDPLSIDAVLISHNHWDHVGGLNAILNRCAARVFVPAGCSLPGSAADSVTVTTPTKLFSNCFSTGLLGDMEQALVIRQPGRAVVVVGCAHPGVGTIIAAASRFGEVRTLVGGLHGFNDFALIERLDAICPAHCTQHIDTINQCFPEKTISAGAGKVLHL
jgi:7,8-dihydropterin-6-yl-methyl-4-(beta-D-ribofuranosyl)aminobenzene 5'-phosphate synthase